MPQLMILSPLYHVKSCKSGIRELTLKLPDERKPIWHVGGTIERPWHGSRSRPQTLEKSTRHLEIGSVKSLREAIVDKRELMTRLIPLTAV